MLFKTLQKSAPKHPCVLNRKPFTRNHWEDLGVKLPFSTSSILDSFPFRNFPKGLDRKILFEKKWKQPSAHWSCLWFGHTVSSPCKSKTIQQELKVTQKYITYKSLPKQRPFRKDHHFMNMAFSNPFLPRKNTQRSPRHWMSATNLAAFTFRTATRWRSARNRNRKRTDWQNELSMDLFWGEKDGKLWISLLFFHGARITTDFFLRGELRWIPTFF